MRLLILGSDGMIGHVVTLFLQEKGHDIVRCEEKNQLLDNYNLLEEEIRKEKFDAIINCTAIINQDAEADKVSAVNINSLLPHFLEKVTAGTETVVVHRSTDCIFSGNKGNYSLDDWPDAISFYARSKFLGELDNEKDITIRTSIIGPEIDSKGNGLFNWFYNQKNEVNGFANAIWTGLTTIEFAREIEWLLDNKKHGIFQLVPDNPISKYDLLVLFERYYPGNRVIKRIENKKVDKSLVPVCGGLTIPDYEKQIAEMRKWTENHKNIYQYI